MKLGEFLNCFDADNDFRIVIETYNENKGLCVLYRMRYPDSDRMKNNDKEIKKYFKYNLLSFNFRFGCLFCIIDKESEDKSNVQKEIIKYLTEIRSDYEKRIKVNEENNQNFIGMYNIAYFNAITDVLNYINNNADNKNNKIVVKEDNLKKRKESLYNFLKSIVFERINIQLINKQDEIEYLHFYEDNKELNNDKAIIKYYNKNVDRISFIGTRLQIYIDD